MIIDELLSVKICYRREPAAERRNPKTPLAGSFGLSGAIDSGYFGGGEGSVVDPDIVQFAVHISVRYPGIPANLERGLIVICFGGLHIGIIVIFAKRTIQVSDHILVRKIMNSNEMDPAVLKTRVIALGEPIGPAPHELKRKVEIT